MKLGAILLLLVTLAPPVSAQSRRVVTLSAAAVGCPPTAQSEAFRQGLVEAGWDLQRAITVDRHCFQELGQAPGIAREIVASRPDVIVAWGGAVFALKETETTIPVVFANVSDPVRDGIVVTLARPGANFTGIAHLSDQLDAKRLEILREILPAVKRVAILANPDFRPPDSSRVREAFHARDVRELRAPATKLGFQIAVYEARNRPEVETAVLTMAQAGERAILVLSDPIFFALRAHIAEAALKHRLPCAAYLGGFVDAGGLFSYAADQVDLGRRAAGYVDRILKGAKPADLPVEHPTKFELAVNMKTAKVLGVTIPRSILLRADRVVE